MKADRWLGGGCAIQLLGLVGGLTLPPPLLIAGGLLFLAGTAGFVFGCCLFAQALGHGRPWGLMGLGGLPGLFILALLPDRLRDEGGFEVVWRPDQFKDSSS